MELDKPKTKRKPNKFQVIISRHCNVGVSPAFWAREMKIAKKLYELCPDEDFWAIFQRPPFIPSKLPSLCYYLTKEGEDYLKDEYSMFCSSLKRKEDFTSQPIVGQKVEIVKKPRTVMDFLKTDYGKET